MDEESVKSDREFVAAMVLEKVVDGSKVDTSKPRSASPGKS
jgi:hypothetical protein